MSVTNIKYLVVLTDLNMGGVTTAAVNLCNGLIQEGNTVDVLVMSDRQTLEEGRFAESIRVLHLSGKDRLWNLGVPLIRRERNVFKKTGLAILGLFKKCINRKSRWIRILFGRKIRFSGYDIAIAFRPCAPCYHFVLRCIEAPKKMGFVHGDIAFMGDVSTWKKYMPEFDAVAFVSNAVRDRFVERFPNLPFNAVTVYNLFDVEEIRRKAQMDIGLIMDSQKINLVTVTRISNADKGTDRIPILCRMLKDRYVGKFNWLVIGDGPDYNQCVEAVHQLDVADHLQFIGKLDNPYPYIAGADLFVFPTRTEAFPMAVGETMILHTPIVTSRYPAAQEILEDGITGIITEQSLDSIFEALDRLLCNPDELNRLKENCAVFEYDNGRSYNQLTEALYGV